MSLLSESPVDATLLSEQERVPIGMSAVPAPTVASFRGIRYVDEFGALHTVDDLAPWLDDAAQRLLEWLQKPPGWDSYGAREISPKAAQAALRLLGVLANVCPLLRPPFIAGTAEGGIACAWEHSRLVLELEVTPSGSISFFYCNEFSGDEWEGPLADDLEFFGKVLWEFTVP